jgi:cytosine/adenosine deaminase-related metal-dependent hydrolase
MKEKQLLEKTVILQAPVVIDRALNVIEDGSVAVCGGRTLAAGPRKEMSAPKKAEVIRLKDAILMPGLVNAHCHLDYTLMKGKVPAKGGFAEWIGRMIEAKKNWNDTDYKRSIQEGMTEAVSYGTTLLANITCVPHLISSLHLERAPRIWWFAEELDIGPSTALRTSRPANQDNFARNNHDGHWDDYLKPRFALQRMSLSPHAPYSVTPDHFSRVVHFCDRHALPWTAHAAESREEWEMFHDAKGALFDLCRGASRDMSDCGGTTPFQRVLGMAQAKSDAQAPALLAHMNCLSEEDLRLLRKYRGHFSVAHCPRSHAFFGHPPFRLSDMRSAGVHVALGTDSLASNSSLSMFSEMRKMRQVFPDAQPRAIVQMATLEGAQALGEGENWPIWADWIAIPGGKEPLSTIIEFADRPIFVMVAGNIRIKS